MINAPIVPPRLVGGLDLAGGDARNGLTIDQAEQTLCSSTLVSEDERTSVVSWGPAQELLVQYAKADHKIEYFQLNPGYRGTLDFTSRLSALGDPTKPNPYGQHTYSIGVGRPVLRDGQTYELNWKKACDPARPEMVDCWEKQATELFDALMYTFAPDLPSTQESCVRDLSCLATSFSTGEAVFGARSLRIYLYIPSIDNVQPGPSTPGFIYGFYR